MENSKILINMVQYKWFECIRVGIFMFEIHAHGVT